MENNEYKENKESIDFKIRELENRIGYTFVNKNLIIEAVSHPSLNKQKNRERYYEKNSEKPNRKDLGNADENDIDGGYEEYRSRCYEKDTNESLKQSLEKSRHKYQEKSQAKVLNKSLSKDKFSKEKKISSLVQNYQFNYQRFEFLGDSVLNFAVTNFLIHKFNYNEGLLAKLRSYLISKNTIVEIAKRFDIGNFILMAQGEEKTGGRENINNIENAMEAIIGAMYMDSGIENTLKWIHKNWYEYYIKCSEEIDEFDPKSKLQEILQSRKMGRPEYLIYSEDSKITHNQVFYAEIDFDGKKFVGSGKNKKEAQKNCAREALKYINNY